MCVFVCVCVHIHMFVCIHACVCVCVYVKVLFFYQVNEIIEYRFLRKKFPVLASLFDYKESN